MNKYASELVSLGVSPNLDSFNYLCRACEMAESNPTIRVTKELYPQIAKEFNSTPSKVERALRYARDRIFNRNNPDFLYYYFGRVVDPMKGTVTNSEMISMIVYNVNKKK